MHGGEKALSCPALKLPVYFQSLHQLHRYKLLCVMQGCYEEQLRVIDMEILLLPCAFSVSGGTLRAEENKSLFSLHFTLLLEEWSILIVTYSAISKKT